MHFYYDVTSKITLHPGSGAQLLSGGCHRVSLCEANTVPTATGSYTLELHCSLFPDGRLQITYDTGCLTCVIPGRTDWNQLLDRIGGPLIEFAMADRYFGMCEDYCYVYTQESRYIWVFWVTKQRDGTLQALIAERARPDVPDLEYAVNHRPGYQDAQLERARTALLKFLATPQGGLGEDSTQSQSLLLRVDPQERWFARFPISLFSQTEAPGFQQYRQLDWLSSGKTLLAYKRDRAQLEHIRSSLSNTLRSTVVVVNTYSKFAHGAARHKTSAHARAGTRLLLDIFRLYESTMDQDGPCPLRWYLNPNRHDLIRIFSEPANRIILGNFEAELETSAPNADWQLGQGERWSYRLPSLGYPSETEGWPVEYLAVDDDFPELSHVLLLRLYHCHSLLTRGAGERGVQPADAETIVGKLLRKGAGHVEGSVTRASYLDFIRAAISYCSMHPPLGRCFNDLIWTRGVAGKRLQDAIRAFYLELGDADASSYFVS